jgi:hypothetical protein
MGWKLKRSAHAIRLDDSIDAMITDLDNAADALAESVGAFPTTVRFMSCGQRQAFRRALGRVMHEGARYDALLAGQEEACE